jgi:hypothetical protein
VCVCVCVCAYVWDDLFMVCFSGVISIVNSGMKTLSVFGNLASIVDSSNRLTAYKGVGYSVVIAGMCFFPLRRPDRVYLTVFGCLFVCSRIFISFSQNRKQSAF